MLDCEYICPSCGGSGEVSYGHETPNGDVIKEGTATCWACNGSGRVREEQVFRHRLIVLARKLAERAVALRQDTALKLKAFALEGERHGFGIETYAEVMTMDAQGHFESELSKLRADLVETLFEVMAVPKPDRWGKPTDDHIPF